MNLNSTIPWSRLDSDTDESWEAFVKFRDMKAPRRLSYLHGYPTGQLSEWYRKHNWRERAAAWDGHMDLILLQEREDFLRQSAKDLNAEHLAILHSTRQLVQRELDKFVAASLESDAVGMISPGALSHLIDGAVKLGRLVVGESTENVASDMDLSQLSVEELKQLRELRIKLNKS